MEGQMNIYDWLGIQDPSITEKSTDITKSIPDDFMNPPEEENELKKGDYIKCHDPEDLAQTMIDLAKEDIETDFVYERNGSKGYWLEIIKVGGSKNG